MTLIPSAQMSTSVKYRWSCNKSAWVNVPMAPDWNLNMEEVHLGILSFIGTVCSPCGAAGISDRLAAIGFQAGTLSACKEFKSTSPARYLRISAK